MVDGGYVEVDTPSLTFMCPYCPEGREFTSLAGAKSHLRRKHPDEPVPPEWGAPRGSRPSPTPPRISEPTPELREIHEELVESIQTVGALVGAVLGQYKEATTTYQVAHEGRALKLPLIGTDAPYLETTIGHTIGLRAPLSAKILMDYSERNSTLLALIMAFNKAMHGGQVGGLVFDHVLGLAHTLQPTSQRLNNLAAARLPDVLDRVMQENAELRAKLTLLQREMGAAAGRPADDERGGGNV